MFFVIAVVLVYFFIIVAGGVLIVLERRFIKQRKKGEWILPIVATVLAIVILLSANKVTTNANISHCLGVTDKGKEIELEVINPVDKKAAIAIGFLKIVDDMKYVEVEFKDGKVIGSKEAMKYKDAIEDFSSRYTKNFTGRSLDYDELRRIVDKKVSYYSLTEFPRYSAFSIVLYMAFPATLWLMFFFSSWRRKKRNQLDKTKLEDL